MFKVAIRGVPYIIKRANHSQLGVGVGGDVTRRDAEVPTIRLLGGLGGQRFTKLCLHGFLARECRYGHEPDLGLDLGRAFADRSLGGLEFAPASSGIEVLARGRGRL